VSLPQGVVIPAGPTQPTGLPDTFWQKFDSSLKGIFAMFPTAGFAYAAYELVAPTVAGVTVGHRRVHGVSGDRLAGVPLTDLHAVMEIASISKTITGVTMMGLIAAIEEVKKAYTKAIATGPLQFPIPSDRWGDWINLVIKYLNKPLYGLLPATGALFPGSVDYNLPGTLAPETVTIGHLMAHTGGIKDGGPTWASCQKALSPEWWPVDTTNNPTVSYFGQFHYSNPGYALLRYVTVGFDKKYVSMDDPTVELPKDDLGWGTRHVQLAQKYALVKVNPQPTVNSSAGQEWQFTDKNNNWFDDIDNWRPDWSLSGVKTSDMWTRVVGNWGWKMSVDQYAQFICSAIVGTEVLPPEYWTFMGNCFNESIAGTSFDPQVKVPLAAFSQYKPRDDNSLAQTWPQEPGAPVSTPPPPPAGERKPYFGGVQFLSSVKNSAGKNCDDFANKHGFSPGFYNHQGNVWASWYGNADEPQRFTDCGCRTIWLQFGPTVFVLFTNNKAATDPYDKNGGVLSMLVDSLVNACS
jgi:hypothetical protein